MKALIPLLVPGLLLLAASLPAPAVAQALPSGPPSTTVSYDVVDLADPRDAAALQRRLRAAVNEVCGTAPAFDPQGRNQVRECRRLTLESLSAPGPSNANAFAAAR